MSGMPNLIVKMTGTSGACSAFLASSGEHRITGDELNQQTNKQKTRNCPSSLPPMFSLPSMSPDSHPTNHQDRSRAASFLRGSGQKGPR